MAIKLKLKTGDTVVVRTGKDKGKTGEIKKVLPVKDRKGKLTDYKAIVAGVNLATKHVKPNPQANVTGGRNTKEMPIHISNLGLLDPATNKPTRVGFKLLKDGVKKRFAKSSNEIIEG